MFQVLKVSLLFLFILIGGGKATATDNILDPSNYYDLTPDQQKQYVIKVMELVVELESRYQHEVVKQGFDWNRYRKYTLMIEKLNEFLIHSAQAKTVTTTSSKKPTPPPAAKSKTVTKTPPKPKPLTEAEKTFDKLGDLFSSLMNTDTKDNKCLYAGWVSEINSQTGKCTHPSNLGGKVADAYKKGSCSKTQIACNPLVFGYKNLDQQTLFCVEAGLSNSANSSHECMNQALADPTPEGADSKERRLEYLSVRIQPYIESIQKLVFKTCICEPKGSKGSMNIQYRDRIRTHRTCHALVNTVRESCSVKPIFDEKFASDLKTISDQIKGLSNESVDDEYTKFLSGYDKNNRDYKMICLGAKAPTCTAKCGQKTDVAEPKAGETVYTCHYEMKDGEEVLNIPSSDQINVKKDQKLKIPIPESARSADCLITEVSVIPLPPPPVPEEVKVSCSIDIKPTEDEKSITATVVVEPKGSLTQVKWGNIEKSADTVKAEEKTEDKKPEEKSEAKPVESEAIYTESKVDEAQVYTATLPNKYKEIKIKAIATVKGKKDPVECEGSYSKPEKEAEPVVVAADGPPKMELKAEKPANNVVKISVVSGEKDGWKIVWDDNKRNETSRNVNQESKEKKICARYVKNDDSDETEKDCETVPALKILQDTTPTSPMNRPQMMPPMMPPMPPGLNIRRGGML